MKANLIRIHLLLLSDMDTPKGRITLVTVIFPSQITSELPNVHVPTTDQTKLYRNPRLFFGRVGRTVTLCVRTVLWMKSNINYASTLG